MLAIRVFLCCGLLLQMQPRTDGTQTTGRSFKILMRGNLGEQIPPGWRILKFSDVGKYSSEVIDLLNESGPIEDQISGPNFRLDEKEHGCQGGWKLIGYGYQVINDKNEDFRFCVHGRILVNEEALKDPVTYSTTYSLCGGFVPPQATTLKYPLSGSLKSWLSCTWTIARPGETFTAVLTKLDISEDEKYKCRYGAFLQFGKGLRYCRKSYLQHKFPARKSLTIRFHSSRQWTSDSQVSGRGFVVNIRNTTGKVQEVPQPACRIVLFEKRDFKGYHDVYTTSRNVRVDDDVSSFKVSEGCCVTLFTDADYKGNSRRFCASSSFVGESANDQLSSIRIERNEWHGGYRQIGCFKDKPYEWGDSQSSDAIRGKRKSYNSRRVIEECYNRALAKRNTHFAIKANVGCYTSSLAHENYDKHGPATGCVRGRGGENVISVYKLLPVCDWKHLSPACVSRHNIKRYRFKTVEQCEQLCVADDSCLSIEYGVNHGGIKKIYKPGNCVLNSGTNSRTCDGRKYNLDLYVKGHCSGKEGVFNQKYRCHWRSGRREGVEIKMEPQPSPHHCVSTCLKLKSKTPAINGVMIKKKQTGVECWCIEKAKQMKPDYKSEYESCIVNLKFEHKDVDECDEEMFGAKHGCQHTCKNTEGSYTCGCYDGYRLANNGRACLISSTATMVKANARDPIPPGWKLVDLKLLGKYVSLAKKVIGENSIVRLDGGWKFYGSGYGYQLKKSDHFMPKVVKDQLLINVKALHQQGTTSSTYSLCGGVIPSNIKRITYHAPLRVPVQCTWTISKPRGTFNIVVRELDLGEPCRDYVQIGGGEKHCGKNPLLYQFSRYQDLTIFFKVGYHRRAKRYIALDIIDIQEPDDLLDYKYQCHWRKGITEGKSSYRTEPWGTVVEVRAPVSNVFKMDSKPTPHHCVSACLALKKKGSNITGVTIKKNNSMVDCLCVEDAYNVKVDYSSDYQSCIINFK